MIIISWFAFTVLLISCIYNSEASNKTLSLKHKASDYSTHKFFNNLGYSHRDDLVNLLFPNRTRLFSNKHLRRLQITKTPYSGSVPCVICKGLSTCSILNGYLIEEVYYPKNLNYLETCKVIESFGNRIKKLIFGNGRTFLDTEQCRVMVMQYLCLFYGSDNPMYTNYCINQENVTDSDSSKHILAPRPPCKSFCVQIATVCANDPDYFIQTCDRISCPPTSETCTPDPTLSGESLDMSLGCTVPYYSSPYFRASAARGISQFTSWIVMITITIVLIFVL